MRIFAAKLVLKIPWKNLYYSSVEAYIEGLYLVIQPNLQVQYDPEKEDKKNLEAKQATLRKIDEAKKKQDEGKYNNTSSQLWKMFQFILFYFFSAKKKIDDTFVEKLTTQIIRNVQVSIKDIHIRYEDKVTNPEHPFSMGVTLSKLVVQTTDSDWVPTVVYEDKAHIKIHKVSVL